MGYMGWRGQIRAEVRSEACGVARANSGGGLMWGIWGGAGKFGRRLVRGVWGHQCRYGRIASFNPGAAGLYHNKLKI